MRFRVYYGDGSTYSGDPLYAPPANAQVIIQEAPIEAGFNVIKGEGHRGTFIWRGEPEGWVCVDESGFWDYMMLELGPKAVCFGRTLRNDEYWELVKRARREGLG